MSTTLKHPDIATALVLPSGLQWKDEFGWVSTVHQTAYTLTGALVVEESTRQAGRPITLEGADDSMGWASRTTVETLLSWAAATGKVFVLTIDGVAHNVVFRNSDPPAVEAKPIVAWSAKANDQWFSLTLKFAET